MVTPSTAAESQCPMLSGYVENPPVATAVKACVIASNAVSQQDYDDANAALTQVEADINTD